MRHAWKRLPTEQGAGPLGGGGGGGTDLAGAFGAAGGAAAAAAGLGTTMTSLTLARNTSMEAFM